MSSPTLNNLVLSKLQRLPRFFQNLATKLKAFEMASSPLSLCIAKLPKKNEESLGGGSVTLTKYHQIHLLNFFPSEVKFQQTRQLKISCTSPRSYICPLVPMVAMSANMPRVLFLSCEVNGSEFQTRTGSRRFHPHKHEFSSKNNAFRTKTTGN